MIENGALQGVALIRAPHLLYVQFLVRQRAHMLPIFILIDEMSAMTRSRSERDQHL
jgi:hypothetical protein